MDRYWLRIGLGAAAVFGVGMVVVKIAEAGKAKIKHVVEGHDPITLPIGFVPFTVAGERFGTIRTLKLIRDDAQRLQSVELLVRLGDRADSQRVPNCDFYIADLQHIDDRTTFVCAADSLVASGALQQLGEIVLSPADRRIRVFGDSSNVRAMRESVLGDRAPNVANVPTPPLPPEAQTEVAAARAEVRAAQAEARAAMRDASVAEDIRRGIADAGGTTTSTTADAGTSVKVNGREVVRMTQMSGGGFQISVVGEAGEQVKLSTGPSGFVVNRTGDERTARLINQYADAKLSAAAARARGDQRAAARAEDRALDIIGEMNGFTKAQFDRAISQTERVAGAEAALPLRRKMESAKESAPTP
jgi:hypothetical protein